MLKACERYDGGTKGLLVSIEHYQNTEQQKQQLVRAKSVSGASCCLVEGGLGGLSSTHIISSALTLSTSCLSAPYQSVTTEEQLLAGTGLVPGHLSGTILRLDSKYTSNETSNDLISHEDHKSVYKDTVLIISVYTFPMGWTSNFPPVIVKTSP